jgi:hypothetical protein
MSPGCAGAAHRTQAHSGSGRPIGLRRTAGTSGKASVPVVLVLASLRRLAVCRSGPGRRNRINNDRLAYRRWLLGGGALGHGAPNGLGARARSVGRFLSLLGVHGWSGDLAAVVEFNVRKWPCVPRLWRLGSLLDLLRCRCASASQVRQRHLGARTGGCGPWTRRLAALAPDRRTLRQTQSIGACRH